MSNEELNRKMEFIVEQQAQFVADIQVMREVHNADVKLLKEQDRRLSDALTSLVGLVGGIAQKQASNEGATARLEAAMARLAEQQTVSEVKMAELAERLNIFIAVVEGHISGNGGAQPRAT
jgi:hypothetical protein